MHWSGKISLALAMVATLFGVASTPAKAEEKKPNILVIMGDDVGVPGAYHRGIMTGKTPNWTSWPPRADFPTIMRKRAAPRVRELHHRRTTDSYWLDDGGTGGCGHRFARPGLHHAPH
jgi:hypothetical protein